MDLIPKIMGKMIYLFIFFIYSYLKFYNYRIPVDHMLSKYVKVGPDGTVTKTGDDKIWHATM